MRRTRHVNAAKTAGSGQQPDKRKRKPGKKKNVSDATDNGSRVIGRPGMPALVGSPTGRPRKIDSPQEFNAMVNEYIRYCMDVFEPITLTGMELWLGFVDHETFYNYANYDGFSECVRRARKIVEYAYELRLNSPQSGGAIFALKNMGWMDERGAGGQAQRRLLNRDRDSVDDDQPMLDVSSLDDDMLEALVAALHQETAARRGPGASGMTH